MNFVLRLQNETRRPRRFGGMWIVVWRPTSISKETSMQKITPCLWFDGQGEEAAKFYVSIFPDSRIVDVMRWGEGGMRPKGTVLTVDFELQGQSFMALNGGPEYKFNPAISMSIDCKNQEEVDRYWSRLLEGGGAEVQCGWLTDKFGVSWQVVPSVLPKYLKDPDTAKADRVMAAMMKMVKLDVAAIQKAYDGK
jgi:predicted 3-demethylubiquinone-9 3-methyltransferase (glyoxalase superfamily)